ncbi:MAG: pyruvate, phosphate dikinase [Planctomycetes bacterium]|nr:pyruvate, phosphate dikinase [Planctomycetota bacterium]
MAKGKKYVYFFGGGKAEGCGTMKELLGGKGANLAEMTSLKIPVPAGFTLTTEVCGHYAHGRKYPPEVKGQVEKALVGVEKAMKKKFGDAGNPLLLSCRSGARASMPGMMETVLNIGLTTATIPGMIRLTGNPRFVWDAYRRLIMMYSDVVMEKAAGIEPAEGQGIRTQLEHLMDGMKKKAGAKLDTDLTAEQLEALCGAFRAKVKAVLGKAFPDSAQEQLWGAIGAVFQSWNGKRAVSYRRIENIPDAWGTAVNVQAMVFGNMGNDSATGVAFTRNPATGENKFFGEWLTNAQGEDVVAGIRTPSPLNEETRSEHDEGHPSLQQAMTKAYTQLVGIRNRLEKHYRDMQDIEFTIEKGTLWMLQTRTGKRTGTAAIRMAVEMLRDRFITKEQAVTRVTPAQLDELLHRILDPVAERSVKVLAKGLPAGPGGACGQIVFTAADAVAAAERGEKVVLCRKETNPEDVEGMRAALGILTALGGMTSHAALVARGWGKCCIVGCGALEISARDKTMKVGGQTFKEGDYVSLNGSRGLVYAGQVPTVDPDPENPLLVEFLASCDKVRTLGVRANADSPTDATVARKFGAAGIGLVRTEHMFYGEGSDEPLFKLRKMILSSTVEERRAACDELFPYVKRDMSGILAAMDGLPVTIRLLDPPLHEFVPQGEAKQAELAQSLGISIDDIRRRAEDLHESNPMMGHRGVRLGVTYPEVSEMQIRAILEATAELRKKGKKPLPEIMIPVTCSVNELKHQGAIVARVKKEVMQKFGLKKLDFLVGTMIEIPRAALTADKMAEAAEFFSFGTNDLTQMTFGFSRDDIGAFMPDYQKQEILAADPFQTVDQEAVGELIRIGIARGRTTRPKLKIGICGEHGGDPASIHFCHKAGMNYVSCSPFRVPIARLAAAQAAVANASKPAAKKAKKAGKPKKAGKARKAKK